MRGTTARRATVALGAVVALILTGAPSAVADDEKSHGRGHDKHSAASDRDDRPARSADTDDRETETDAAEADDADDTAKPDRPKAKGETSEGDPPGNNGTIKIDGPPYDVANGNEPHVTCEFAVRFFGFDADQHADIRVTGHAPTGAGTLVAERLGVLVSDDAAGGGKDVDATIVFTAGQLSLTGITPHPKQGYHLKVTADALEAPGGAKSKVLWLEPCAAAPAVESTAGTADSTGGLAGKDAALTGAPAPTATADADALVMGVVTSRSAAAPADADADAGAVGTGDADVDSAAATRARGGLLPFTGAGAILMLVLLAAVLLTVGSGVLAASRRRRTEV